MTAQSMATAIAGLLDRGPVAWSPNPGHGRILDVRITEDGLDLLARVQVQVVTRRLEQRALAALSDGRRRELRAILRLMTADLELCLPPEGG